MWKLGFLVGNTQKISYLLQRQGREGYDQAQGSKRGSKSLTLNKAGLPKTFKFIELNFRTLYLLYGSAAEISCLYFSAANLSLPSGHLVIFPECVQFKGHPSFREDLINRIGHPLCSSWEYMRDFVPLWFPANPSQKDQCALFDI